MVNKPKIQGTRFETQTKELLQSWGHKAYRLAEGGLKDKGDVQAEINNGMLPMPEIIFECKARQALNIHQTYAKAKEKAGSKPLVLAWKKLLRKGDNKKRTADGISTLYIIDEDLLKELLNGYQR
jgi:Holliday junction resolvase